ncbi:MAG TPA: PBP1A family penicillin-binding protein [Gaiellaceae bacterium]|jgi:penicillin-binding protein 1A|nr:PBP1A family penicillin-binding protein [Gaiellaceae bacterium]
MSPPRRRRSPLDPDTLRPRGRHQRALRRRRRRSGAAAAVIAIVALAAIAGVGGGAAVLAYGSSCDLDSLQSVDIGANTFVYAANGSLLGSIPAERNREPVTAADMSLWIRKATIAIEDRRFFEHDGVDVEGIARAAVENLRAGEIVEGGSTITQQLVRNLYISREQTVQRKVKEACLATKLDGAWSKERILTEYLNQSFYGNRAYGIEAAAQTYFSKPAEDLTLAEAALLAGLPQAPSIYDPFTAPGPALARRQEVLRAMADTGVITPRIYRKALDAPLRLRRGRLYDRIREPYFFGYVRDRLIEAYGAQQVRSGGLKVYTTIIPRYQRLAESAIRDTLDDPDDPASALISISPRTGAIRAMTAVVPNRPKNQFNLVSQARRQPGSTFKTFVLAAAVEQGINPDSTYYVSAPFTYRIHPAGNCDDGSWWCVKTYANDYYGWSSIRSATLRSDNSVYAQLTLDVGPEKVAEVARRMGVRSQLDIRGDYVPAIGLGSIAVSPLDLASSYATLAAGGVYAEPMAIRRVVLADGTVDTQAGWGKPKRRRAISEGVAAIVTRILEQNVQSGTGTRAAFGRPAAGKTGTAELNVDAWFAGYTPELATTVWIGYTRAEIPLDNVHGIAVTGGSFPAEIWRLFMEPALDGTEPKSFPEPRVWPTWKPFTRGEFALSYDPNATRETEESEETETTPRESPERGTGR